MAVIIHDNEVIDADTIFLFIFCPQVQEIAFYLFWFKQVLTVVTPKKYVGVRRILNYKASCVHNQDDGSIYFFIPRTFDLSILF